MSEKKNKYVVVDSVTEQVVAKGLQSRREARNVKRDLEIKTRTIDGVVHPGPSRYYVESDIDHPAGAGIYYH